MYGRVLSLRGGGHTETISVNLKERGSKDVEILDGVVDLSLGYHQEVFRRAYRFCLYWLGKSRQHYLVEGIPRPVREGT